MKSKNKNHRPRISLCILVFLLSTSGCRKLIEIPAPSFSITESNVYSNNTTAISVLSGIYTGMSTTDGGFSGSTSISLYLGLSGDELTLYSGVSFESLVRHYQNELIANQSVQAGTEHWAPLYNYVFKCNAAIEGLGGSESLTPAVKKQLIGEAKFMRAFFYFYLVNLYGNVPLALTTDYKINTQLAREPKDKVYEQIIADLKAAGELLSNEYLDATLLKSTKERVRPTKWAAAALLARVYLYMGDYVNAEEQATKVINNSALFGLPAVENAFLKNNNEAIWQIQPTTVGFNTWDAVTFVLANGFTNGPDQAVYLSSQLLTSFEPTDKRRNGKWVDSVTINGSIYYYPFKYKKFDFDPGINGPSSLNEYLMVLRNAEQYLIRAEARAQRNNISGSQNDLNAIRSRSGLLNTSANDKTSLLTAILHERQVELFSEWGHRWLDLKRTNKLNAIMSAITPLKGGTWQSTDTLCPLPFTELQKAPNLIQNPGY